MTFAIGRRFVIVDGVERWKDADVERRRAGARGAGRRRRPSPSSRARTAARRRPAGSPGGPKAGGDVSAEADASSRGSCPSGRPPRRAQLGLELEPGAAQALVAARRRAPAAPAARAREARARARRRARGSGAEEVEELAASSAERKAWSLADALVARDGAAALAAYLELRAQGERLPRPALLDPTRPCGTRSRSSPVWRPARARRRSGAGCGCRARPPSASSRTRAATDRDVLRGALRRLADLELDSRGGRALEEDTAAARAILAIAR